MIEIAIGSLKRKRNRRGNDLHVGYLVGLIENGHYLLPIVIDANLNVIDGSHRIQAYEQMGATKIFAEIRE